MDVDEEEQERKELCAELARIESDLARQLIRVYMRVSTTESSGNL